MSRRILALCPVTTIPGVTPWPTIRMVGDLVQWFNRQVAVGRMNERDLGCAALAGIAPLPLQVGQLEQALTLIGLVQHHPSSYRETKDRLVALETVLRAKLSPVQVQAALAQGQASELWATVATVRSLVETEAPVKQPTSEVRIEVDSVGMAQQVSKITGTDYFQHLRGKANELRTLIADVHQ